MPEGQPQTIFRRLRIGNLLLGGRKQVHGGIRLVKNQRPIGINIEIHTEHLQGNPVANHLERLAGGPAKLFFWIGAYPFFLFAQVRVLQIK